MLLGAMLDSSTKTPRHWYALALCGAAGALAFAFFTQFVLDWPPCSLCITQRWPYAVVIALAVLGMAAATRLPCIANAGLVAASGVGFAVTGGVGVYHSGVEYGWWKGPGGCTLPVDFSSMPLSELREFIQNAPIIKCDDPTWLLEPVLTMAGGNAIYAFTLMALMFHGAWVLARRKGADAA